MQIKRKQDLKEKLIVSVGFIGIFLPVRLVFYTFVSDWWIGSLGVVSVLAFTVTYLSHKDRFGWFGRLWKKQIQSIAKGRLGTFFIVSAIFFIVTYAFVLDGMQKGYDHESFQLVVDTNEVQAMPSIEDTFQDTSSVDILIPDVEALESILSEVTIDEFYQLITIALAVMDYKSAGWFQHFYIVFFVEEIEKMALMIYFRWFYKTNTI